MIGVEARELRKDDVILGVGTVIRCLNGPDAWGEMTFKVKDDNGLWAIKLDADAWLRIERQGAE